MVGKTKEQIHAIYITTHIQTYPSHGNKKIQKYCAEQSSTFNFDGVSLLHHKINTTLFCDVIHFKTTQQKKGRERNAKTMERFMSWNENKGIYFFKHRFKNNFFFLSLFNHEDSHRNKNFQLIWGDWFDKKIRNCVIEVERGWIM